MAHEEESRRLHARENSTLILATVAASASLLILATVFDNSVSLQDSWISWIGLIFSMLGPLYREVTIFTIDLSDYRRIGERRREYRWLDVIPRMVIVRFFLFLPIVAWIIFLTSPTCRSTTALFTLVVIGLLSLILSVIEWLSRDQYALLEREPIKGEKDEAKSPKRGEREAVTQDADKWFLETFSMMMNSIFIASLVASVAAQGWWKIGWGLSTILFGVLFLASRLVMGRRIHAPRLHIFLMIFFLIAVIIIGLFIIQMGYLQL